MTQGMGIPGNYLSIGNGMQRDHAEKVRIVCCSDTHGKHREIDIPNGDIFIHAGDFTRFSNIADAQDFNEWLGDEDIFGDFKLKVVVNGNHESNAPWRNEIKDILSNATVLKNESCQYHIKSENKADSTGGDDEANTAEEGTLI